MSKMSIFCKIYNKKKIQQLGTKSDLFARRERIAMSLDAREMGRILIRTFRSAE